MSLIMSGKFLRKFFTKFNALSRPLEPTFSSIYCITTKVMSNQTVNYSLSSTEILSLYPNRVQIVVYGDMCDVTSIEQLFEEVNLVVILFETSPSYGHWTLLINRPDSDVIEFFDPYGMVPDTELAYIPKDFRRQSCQDFPRMLELLYNSHKQVRYNNFDFQKQGPGINTCGRWVLLRIVFSRFDEYQFKGIVDNLCDWYDSDQDQMVTQYTNNLMNFF